jgi:hypothetical protein
LAARAARGAARCGRRSDLQESEALFSTYEAWLCAVSTGGPESDIREHRSEYGFARLYRVQRPATAKKLIGLGESVRPTFVRSV